VLQVGNLVSAMWRARLDEHLGYYVIEGLDLRAASYLSMAHALYGLNHLGGRCAGCCRSAIRTSRCSISLSTRSRISATRRSLPCALVARFELQLLAELGFGLDLDSCAAHRRNSGTRLCIAKERPGGVAGSRRAVA